MKRLVVFFTVLIYFSAQAQPIALSAAALGNGLIGQHQASAFSIFYNQSQMTQLKGLHAGIFYLQPLSVPDISTKALAITYGFRKNGAIGIGYYIDGIENYNYQKLGIGYGLKIFSNFRLGAQINLHIINQPNYYGDLYLATGELSFSYDIGEDLQLFSRIFNVLFFIQKTYNLPAVFDIGTYYTLGRNTYLTAQVEKNIYQPPSYHWGLGYKFFNIIDLRLGGFYQAGYYNFTFGLGISLKQFMSLDLGFMNQPYLGMLSAFAIKH